MGNNAAGAKYGTGYCDAQCPHDMKFIKGTANVEDWNTSTGMGKMGICCPEMDIWEANKTSTQYTAHPCHISEGSFACNDPVTCGDGDNRFNKNAVCDKDGCDNNPYRMGVKDFFGEGMTVDSGRPMTVVTQFITENGTDNSDIVEIKRFYVQDGKKFENPMSDV
jgi:cellulose 1,4-beta-cellobiosidase